MSTIWDQTKYISELDIVFIIVHLLFVIRENVAVFACMCVLKRDRIGG